MNLDELRGSLSRAAHTDRTTFRPEILRASVPADAARMGALVKAGVFVHDELQAQLAELVRCLNPSKRYTASELVTAAEEYLGGRDQLTYGVWVHFPWANRLVHILDEAEFVLVRTNRNRNKITAEEQALLATKVVGVIGLSVGQSVCLTLALERSFGELRIADFDTLDLSNLNRIRSGIHEMGHRKAVNVAREIAELDPFLKVIVFEEGVNEGNLDRFCLEGGKLDVLIDECDGVDVKILCRMKARGLGIPVLMDTSDRGMIDVERFDLEPERPILHGLIDHLDPRDAAKARTNEEKLPFVLPIAGIDTLSTRMKASMLEIESSVTTWPQLASSVVLGGGVTADTWRRMALGQFNSSGRWFVDLEEVLTTEGSAGHDSTGRPKYAALETTVAHELAKKAFSKCDAEPLDESIVRQLVEAAIQAPSAGNLQPWKVLHHLGQLFIFHDAALGDSGLDPGRLIPAVDMGVFIENMEIRASELGFTLHIETYPLKAEHRLVAIVRRGPATDRTDALAVQIPERCTNRKKGDARSFAHTSELELEQAAARIEGCRAHFITDRGGMDEVAMIIGEAERVRLLHPVGHAEMFSKEMRWTSEDAYRERDGLDLPSMELKPTEEVGLRVAMDRQAIDLLAEWDGGRGFMRMARENIASASAIALISAPSGSPLDLLNGGRATERLWLSATALGLSVHPCSAPILLAHPVRNGHSAVFSPHRSKLLLDLYQRLTSAFGLIQREPVFMFRLSYSASPSVRSLRRPISAFLLPHESAS
jgi:nitroreductase/molybdopterin/thiamine biosynthesis adenylyltransferase